MKRIVLASTLALFSIGCGHRLMQPKVTTVSETKTEKVSIALPESQAEPQAALRQPGDYVVYRFSGSYSDKPIKLTQKVIARNGNDLIVDLTIEGRQKPLHLRLRLDDGPDAGGELVSVARLEGNVQLPFGVEAYDELMNGIVLAADSNDGEVGVAYKIVDVGKDEIPCIQTSYRVRVGAQDAIMHTLASHDFIWGHVGGDITTLDGKVLYKAEIVEMGAAAPTSGTIAASTEDESVYEVDIWDLE